MEDETKKEEKVEVLSEEEVVFQEEIAKKEALEVKRETLKKSEMRPTDDPDVVEIVNQKLTADILAEYDMLDAEDDAEIARRQASKLKRAELRNLFTISTE